MMPQGGTATPIAPGLVARARDGMRYIVSGVTPSTWFGPMQPIAPQAPAEVAGRQFDYPFGYNLNTRPRADEPVSFQQLRSLADSLDLLRTIIETRKDQIERLDWTIRPRDRIEGERAGRSRDPRIAEIESFFRMPDQTNFWSSWLRQILEDLFVIDAPALYLRRARSGRLYALEPIDGATVKRLLNADGRTPLPPDPAYQQVLHGLPAADLTTRDLIYRPRNLRAHRIYGYSPVEQIVMTVNIALRRQMFQLSYYTEGNVPEALIGTPESWGPNQIKEFQQYWDALLEGNLAQRRHAKFVPGGVAKTFIPTKDAELKNDYDEWLARVICFAFSISPQPFVDRMNRATAETAHQTALAEGLAPIQNWIKQLVDYVIVTEFGAPDLEFRWRDDSDPDPATAASVAQVYVTSGIKSVNEVRAEIGLDPVPGGDVPRTAAASVLPPVRAAPGLARRNIHDGTPEQGKASGLDRHPSFFKVGFDPGQPRDDDGRWTGADGGSGGSIQIVQADTGVANDAQPIGSVSAGAGASTKEHTTDRVSEIGDAPNPEEQQKQLDAFAAAALPALREQAQAQQQVAVQLVYTDSAGNYQLSGVAYGGMLFNPATFDRLEATLPKAYEGVSALLVGHYSNLLSEADPLETIKKG